MNRTNKIILGLAAGAAVICLCAAAGSLFFLRTTGRVLGKAIDASQADVEKVAGGIASYTLPAGFGEGYAIQVAGFSMVSYTGEDGHSHVYFFQLPEGVHVDQAELERRFRESARSQDSNWDRQTEVVDQVPATIAGQEVTLVVSEGVNHAGQSFRQISGMFQGQGGQALVVFERPPESWDQAEVDEFLASIR
jgi:hypothetical protein